LDIGGIFPGVEGALRSAHFEVGGVNVLDREVQYSSYSPFLGYDPTQADIRGRFLYARVGVNF